MRRMTVSTIGLSLVLLASAGVASAQPVTLPPSGNNQKASVTQHIGLVTVTIEYSSPHTISPAGEDRRGKIWGTLEPYGIYDLGFNNRRGPWRAAGVVDSLAPPNRVCAAASEMNSRDCPTTHMGDV